MLGIMLAIKLSKAFDSIEFTFIEAALRFFKFSNKQFAWIKILLKDFTIVILHAKNIFDRVGIGRGCRQGDPIASLIFILCIEILMMNIRTSDRVKPLK